MLTMSRELSHRFNVLFRASRPCTLRTLPHRLTYVYMKLEEVLDNLKSAVERYQNVPLIEVMELSEILRDLGCNLSYLVQLRKEYYLDFQSVVFNSKASSTSAKIKEAEMRVPELDEVRKILHHYSELQKDLRSQISLWKNEG